MAFESLAIVEKTPPCKEHEGRLMLHSEDFDDYTKVRSMFSSIVS